MHKRERQNFQILTSKGEISEARRLENETAQKLYDKLLSNTSTLAVSCLCCVFFGEVSCQGIVVFCPFSYLLCAMNLTVSCRHACV